MTMWMMMLMMIVGIINYDILVRSVCDRWQWEAKFFGRLLTPCNEMETKRGNRRKFKLNPTRNGTSARFNLNPNERTQRTCPWVRDELTFSCCVFCIQSLFFNTRKNDYKTGNKPKKRKTNGRKLNIAIKNLFQLTTIPTGKKGLAREGWKPGRRLNSVKPSNPNTPKGSNWFDQRVGPVPDKQKYWTLAQMNPNGI